jgi:hypothetical protein
MIFLLSLFFAGTDKKQRARAEKETGWGKKVKEHNQLSVPRHAGAPQAHSTLAPSSSSANL